MDLSKIKTLIDFVGRSSITELAVCEKDTTVRIFRSKPGSSANADFGVAERNVPEDRLVEATTPQTGLIVTAPVFGVLHTSPAPGDAPFVAAGDEVAQGQTLFIIEAMKVFNTVASPRAGRIVRLTDANGTEVAAGDMLAEIE